MGQGICAFPSRLSQRAVPRATVVSVDVDPRLESRGSAGKQVSLEWTETSGGLWEWFHDPELVGKTCGKDTRENPGGCPLQGR